VPARRIEAPVQGVVEPVGEQSYHHLAAPRAHRDSIRHAAIIAPGALLPCRAMASASARAYGPSAIGGDLRRFAELTLMMARTDFKLRYFGSALGYLWSLFRPLLFFGILFFFFTKILHVGHGIPHYGVYLLTGIILWNYFIEATGSSVQALVSREGMLRKVRFPRMVIPLSVSLTASFNLAMNLITVFVFALLNGVTPRLPWLELIPIVGGFIVMGTGIGMLLSALYVRFRDVAPIWDVTAQAWFYASPIMYVATSYAAGNGGFTSITLEHVMLINPIGMLLTQMGHALIGGPAFASATVVGSTPSVIAAVATMLAVFALGWWVFTREAPRVAENL
jgi:ABC-2 type transport system permease protein